MRVQGCAWGLLLLSWFCISFWALIWQWVLLLWVGWRLLSC
jgi:hypothetical protein